MWFWGPAITSWGVKAASLWQGADFSSAYTPTWAVETAQHNLAQQPKPQLGTATCRGHSPADSSVVQAEAGFRALDCRTRHAP